MCHNTDYLRTHYGYFPNSLRPISYLEYIWVMPEKQSFFYKKLNNGNHAQGTHSHSSKIGADISAENTPNTPQFILQIGPIGSKVWDIVKKRLHRASVIRGHHKWSLYNAWRVQENAL